MSPILGASLVFGMLVFVIPISLLPGLNIHQVSFLSLAPLAILGFAAAKLGALAYSGKPRFISLTFWIFVYSFFGVTPLFQIVSGEYSMRGYYSPTDLLTASGIVIVGLIGYEIGQATSKAPSIGAQCRRFVLRVTNRRIVASRAVIMTMIGLTTLGLAMALLGPLEFLFSSRAELFEAFAALPGPGQVTLQLATSAVRFPLVLASLGFLVLLGLRDDKEISRKRYVRQVFPIFAALVVLVTLLANNPINAPRYLVGSTFLALLFVLAMCNWKRYFVSITAIGMASLLLLVFPTLDAYRYSVSNPQVHGWNLREIVQNITSKGDFDAFQQLLNVVQYVDQNGLTFGKQIVGALFFFYPRTFWLDKPEATGQMIGAWAGYKFTNLSCPLWGELYIDFGILGVIVGMMAYGWVVGVMENDRNVRMHPGEQSFQTAGIALFAAYQIFLLRGSLLPALAYLTPLSLGLWLMSRRKSRQSVQWI